MISRVICSNPDCACDGGEIAWCDRCRLHACTHVVEVVGHQGAWDELPRRTLWYTETVRIGLGRIPCAAARYALPNGLQLCTVRGDMVLN
jgi:hypothetical protein